MNTTQVNQQHEEWKPIPGYSFCEASNLGRIRTVYPYNLSQKQNSRNFGRPPRIKVLAQSLSPRGYYGVIVFRDSDQRRLRTTVHRLVALAFLGESNRNDTVNHKNFIRTDNRAENLEWMSLSENVRHSFSNQKRKPRTLKRLIPSDSDRIFIQSLIERGVNPKNISRIFIGIETEPAAKSEITPTPPP